MVMCRLSNIDGIGKIYAVKNLCCLSFAVKEREMRVKIKKLIAYWVCIKPHYYYPRLTRIKFDSEEEKIPDFFISGGSHVCESERAFRDW